MSDGRLSELEAHLHTIEASLVAAAAELAHLRELAELVREWQAARMASIRGTATDEKGNLIYMKDLIDRLAEAESRLNAWGKE